MGDRARTRLPRETARRSDDYRCRRVSLLAAPRVAGERLNTRPSHGIWRIMASLRWSLHAPGRRTKSHVAPLTSSRPLRHQEVLAPRPLVDRQQGSTHPPRYAAAWRPARAIANGLGGWSLPATHEPSTVGASICRVVVMGVWSRAATRRERLRLGHASMAPLADEHEARIAGRDVRRRM